MGNWIVKPLISHTWTCFSYWFIHLAAHLFSYHLSGSQVPLLWGLWLLLLRNNWPVTHTHIYANNPFLATLDGAGHGSSPALHDIITSITIMKREADCASASKFLKHHSASRASCRQINILIAYSMSWVKLCVALFLSKGCFNLKIHQNCYLQSNNQAGTKHRCNKTGIIRSYFVPCWSV